MPDDDGLVVVCGGWPVCAWQLIKLWDLRSSTSMPFATLKGHTQGVLSVSWCPFDSTFLLSTGRDNRTLLWDLFNHQQPAYELPASNAGSEAEMSSVAFGGFGRGESRRYSAVWSPLLPAVIGTCSFDRTVEFFSLSGRRQLHTHTPRPLLRT